jgi:hypothetical protein
MLVSETEPSANAVRPDSFEGKKNVQTGTNRACEINILLSRVRSGRLLRDIGVQTLCASAAYCGDGLDHYATVFLEAHHEAGGIPEYEQDIRHHGKL